jgi:hypothetical protein
MDDRKYLDRIVKTRRLFEAQGKGKEFELCRVSEGSEDWPLSGYATQGELDTVIIFQLDPNACIGVPETHDQILKKGTKGIALIGPCAVRESCRVVSTLAQCKKEFPPWLVAASVRRWLVGDIKHPYGEGVNVGDWDAFGFASPRPSAVAAAIMKYARSAKTLFHLLNNITDHYAFIVTARRKKRHERLLDALCDAVGAHGFKLLEREPGFDFKKIRDGAFAYTGRPSTLLDWGVAHGKLSVSIEIPAIRGEAGAARLIDEKRLGRATAGAIMAGLEALRSAD